MNPENHSSLPPLPLVKIGIVSVSDRASTGVYEDKGLPALKDWLGSALKNPLHFEARLIPDEMPTISATLVELVDAGCSLNGQKLSSCPVAVHRTRRCADFHPRKSHNRLD